jgi:hypothetical protein
MADMSEVRHLSVSIARNAELVYDFLSDPASFPKWASGLGTLSRVDGRWVAQTPDGPMQVRFSERNAFGVLDHWATPQPDVQIYIPLRVVANGEGCELIFTLFRQPGMDQERFEADAEWVKRDLNAAKHLLEGA